MKTEVVLLAPDQAQGIIGQFVRVYRAAFGMPPHNKREAEVARFADILPEQMRREDFRCCIARNNEGHMLGFAYGFAGRHGQWWYDSVARNLDQARFQLWLSDCFEFMEFAVLPIVQKQGIGGQIHDLILRDLPHRTAVLSTPQIQTPALHLYRKKGWVTVLEDFIFPGDTSPFLIMGLELAKTPNDDKPDLPAGSLKEVS
jgi:GNAT superfamily N-acetyltransferase